MSEREDRVRREVSKAYSEAILRPRSGCCSCGQSAQQKLAADLAGYKLDELQELPGDAGQSSFGCGNPVAIASLRPGEVVLDLGSGAGIDLFLAAQKVGPTGRVIGIDMTDEMLARAKENIRASHFTNIEVRKGIIEELPVESASIDCVISNCVINLSPEKPKVFREIARVLKPGGRMMISDIVAEQLPEAVLQNAALYSSCVAGAISEAEYVAGLREAGLVDVEVRSRLVYGADQLASAVELGASGGLLGPAPDLLRAIAGKIWSAALYARKPEEDSRPNRSTK